MTSDGNTSSIDIIAKLRRWNLNKWSEFIGTFVGYHIALAFVAKTNLAGNKVLRLQSLHTLAYWSAIVIKTFNDVERSWTTFSDKLVSGQRARQPQLMA